MKNAIKVWSAKWYRTFSEWLKGTKAEWNPIYNYDRYEEGWDDSKKHYSSVNQADYSDKRTANLEHNHILNTKDERTADLEDKRTANLEDERTADLEEKRVANLKDESTSGKKDESTFNNADITSQTKESTTEHKVAAYDSSSYVPSSQDIVNNGDSKTAHVGTVTNETDETETTSHTGSDTMSTTGSDTMKHTGTDTTAHTGTDTTAHTGNEINNETGTDETTHKGKLSDITGKEQNTNQHTAHLYGNIGVTTSAAMLAEFYQVAKWNLYEHMADVFGSELLIQVY